MHTKNFYRNMSGASDNMDVLIPKVAHVPDASMRQLYSALEQLEKDTGNAYHFTVHQATPFTDPLVIGDLAERPIEIHSAEPQYRFLEGHYPNVAAAHAVIKEKCPPHPIVQVYPDGCIVGTHGGGSLSIITPVAKVSVARLDRKK